MRRGGVLTERDRQKWAWISVRLTGDAVRIDARLGSRFRIVLTRDITLEIHNPAPGQEILLRFEQDSAGGYTVSPSGAFTFRGDPSTFGVAVAAGAVTYARIVYDDDGRIWDVVGLPSLASVYDPAGTAAAAITTHEGAPDPHPGYLTPLEGDAAYQPLAGRLTDLRTVTYETAALDVNQTDTDIATLTGLPSKYRVRVGLAHTKTGTPTSAVFALRTQSAGGGDAIIAAVALASLTTGDAIQDFTIALTAQQTASPLYLRITTPAGVAATCKFYFEVLDLS